MNNNKASEQNNTGNIIHSSEASSKRTVEFWISKMLSILLHPLLIPSYFSAWVLFQQNPEGRQKELALYLLLLIVVFTLVLPIIVIYGLWRVGLIKSIHLHERTDRVLPMFFVALVYAACLYSLRALFIITYSFIACCLA